MERNERNNDQCVCARSAAARQYALQIYDYGLQIQPLINNIYNMKMI